MYYLRTCADGTTGCGVHDVLRMTLALAVQGPMVCAPATIASVTMRTWASQRAQSKQEGMCLGQPATPNHACFRKHQFRLFLTRAGASGSTLTSKAVPADCEKDRRLPMALGTPELAATSTKPAIRARLAPSTPSGPTPTGHCRNITTSAGPAGAARPTTCATQPCPWPRSAPRARRAGGVRRPRPWEAAGLSPTGMPPGAQRRRA
jgi:hypothetical protein